VTVTFQILGTSEKISLDNFHGLVAGYTGRDAAAVQAHIDELAAIGVAPPPEVPMFYSVDAATMNSDAEYVDSSMSLTSGEVEPVYIRHAGVYYIGIGSDHTDRDLERTDIADSKRACPKPVSHEVIRVGSLADLEAFSLDDATARSTVDGKLYQEGRLSGLRTPYEISTRLIDRLGLVDADNFVCLGGTVPLLDGAFTAGERWHIEIELADGTRLAHEYRMK
jgi:4-hydroxyphenylacetate 3-monooxygenase